MNDKLRSIAHSDVPNDGIPFLELPSNANALKQVKMYAKGAVPTVLLVEGSVGNGKTRLINLALSYVSRDKPSMPIFFMPFLEMQAFMTQYSDYKDALIVVGSLAVPNVHPGDIALRLVSFLKLNISLVVETADHRKAKWILGRGMNVIHAKIGNPSPAEQVDFARHIFPYVTKRVPDPTETEFLSSLVPCSSLRSVLCEVKKHELIRQIKLKEKQIT